MMCAFLTFSFTLAIMIFNTPSNLQSVLTHVIVTVTYTFHYNISKSLPGRSRYLDFDDQGKQILNVQKGVANTCVAIIKIVRLLDGGFCIVEKEIST